MRGAWQSCGAGPVGADPRGLEAIAFRGSRWKILETARTASSPSLWRLFIGVGASRGGPARCARRHRDDVVRGLRADLSCLAPAQGNLPARVPESVGRGFSVPIRRVAVPDSATRRMDMLNAVGVTLARLISQGRFLHGRRAASRPAPESCLKVYELCAPALLSGMRWW